MRGSRIRRTTSTNSPCGALEHHQHTSKIAATARVVQPYGKLGYEYMHATNGTPPMGMPPHRTKRTPGSLSISPPQRPKTKLHDALPRIVRQATLAIFTLVFQSLMLISPTMSQAPPATQAKPVITGADGLVASEFALLEGKRVGLITNQTGLSNGTHLADLMHQSPHVTLHAILAPEHGFRGKVEAGDKVSDEIDPKTGIRVFSLYGKTRKPTPDMLRNLDVLVFDIQDVGVRYYTYISTMGLVMQAAAEAKIPLIVLDRPNPLGGTYVSGFVLEPKHTTFVGQYPIPIVHGMTVGELALMIKNEKWLEGLDALQLTVVEMSGWTRNMRWPQTLITWVPTSPNIPTFNSALLYPGLGFLSELNINDGRGTPTPFTLFGAPWYNASRAISRFNEADFAGIELGKVTYVPKSIPGVAQNPRFKNSKISGVAVHVSDPTRVEPLEMGIHALVDLMSQAENTKTKLFPSRPMFYALSGTKRLYQALNSGSDAHTIIESWTEEVRLFKSKREPYLLY